MTTKNWKPSKDPLFRGDRKSGINVPKPNADDSIVRHILFLEGPGRETPYLSTTEEYDVAEYFAQSGTVWKTFVTELLSLMKGNGKGNAKWSSAFEVMQARRYVEQWGEHLPDFRQVVNPIETVKKIFKKS